MSNKPLRPKHLPKSIYWKVGMIIALVLLYLLIQWTVHTFQKPNHMGLVESQTMEMTVKPPEGAMPVATETLKPQPFENSVTYTGSTVAYNDIPVYPRVQGWIVAMNVYPGDWVKRGQPLAQLDSRELSSRVNEAEYAKQEASQGYDAAISIKNQALAQSEKARQGIQSAQANLEYWQNEIKRARTLVKEEVITPEEAQREQSQFEAAQSQYNQALSELKAAQAGVHAAEFQTAAQHAKAKQVGAALRTQEIIRGYTNITAPLDGVITERIFPKGTLVSPEMQILRLAQIDPIRIQAHVAQKDWERIRLGNRVRIWQIKDQNASPVEATVTAIFPVADVQSRTAIVEAVVPNPNEHFIPGDYIRMDIVTGQRKQALAVPNTALVPMNQQEAVWVSENGKAALKYVTTGETDGVRTEILSGLNAGDVVIIRGNQDLQPGMSVASAQYGPEGVQALPEAVSNRLNAANHYKVTVPVETMKLTVELLKKPPVAGDNPISFTFSPIPMGAMVMPLPSNLEIEVKTIMLAMPTMPSSKPVLQKISPAQFRGSVIFSMPGLWQIEIAIKEKGRIIATQKLDVEVGTL